MKVSYLNQKRVVRVSRVFRIPVRRNILWTFVHLTYSYLGRIFEYVTIAQHVNDYATGTSLVSNAGFIFLSRRFSIVVFFYKSDRLVMSAVHYKSDCNLKLI